MSEPAGQRIVSAVHGLRDATPDPPFEAGFSAWLRAELERAALLDLYGRFSASESPVDALMRRLILRALARRVGDGLRVGSSVGFLHPETFEIGQGVFIGAQAYLQGRFDGRLVIGDHVWIGPQSYFDARDLVIEEYVGWGPGAKVLGSTHTGVPIDLPIIQTDLRIAPVRVDAWADVGTNATILPGVTIGRGSIIGAGAVVTRDVPAFSIVAGVPARVISWRDPAQAERAARDRANLPAREEAHAG